MYLFEDVLLPHELLSFSVGLVDHDLQHVLPTVGDVHHKEHQVLQQFGDKSARRHTNTNKIETAYT